MKISVCLVLALIFGAVSSIETARSQEVKLSADQAHEENAYAVGLEAYLWGFPLREYGAVLPASVKAGAANINDLRKFTALKSAKDRTIVTPNNVTIDAYGAFDVTREPEVIFVPALKESRWYIVQIGDHFDEIIRNIGGTKGPQPGVYLITGPDYSGAVPGDMVQVRSRTKFGAVAVRILANGSADLPRAVDAQKGFQMMPLSAYLKDGLAHKPASPRESFDGYVSSAPPDIRYFDELGHWMNRFLSISDDADNEFVASLHQIGLSVGEGFRWQGLDNATRQGLARAIRTGGQIVDNHWAAAGQTVDGWKYTFAGGRAGYDPALRAALAKFEIGAQLSDQVLYPNTAVDDGGEPLTGTRKYVLHFDADKLPPVSVFWNMAMYASDMLFVENDFGRYSIGSTTDGLKKDADGSLTILIQHDRPADMSNWLPAPAGPFNLTMRLYGPETSVLGGEYHLPAVKRAP